jgi:RNA polymerase sigma-70 factor, ECF subfamily
MENVTLARINATLADEDEISLVEAARSDPDAFTILYRRYVTPVYRYLYKWVANQEQAEDLTSQVFTEVLQGLPRFRPQSHDAESTFSAWLFTIARRKAIAAHRRSRPELPLFEAESLPHDSPDLLDKVIQSERLAHLESLFASLEVEKRDLLRLRFSAGLSFAEMATVLGRSQAAVKMAVYRVLRQLNEKWKE